MRSGEVRRGTGRVRVKGRGAQAGLRELFVEVQSRSPVPGLQVKLLLRSRAADVAADGYLAKPQRERERERDQAGKKEQGKGRIWIKR